MNFEALIPWVTPLIAGAIGLYARSLVSPLKQRLEEHIVLLENRRRKECELFEAVTKIRERLAALEAK